MSSHKVRLSEIGQSAPGEPVLYEELVYAIGMLAKVLDRPPADLDLQKILQMTYKRFEELGYTKALEDFAQRMKGHTLVIQGDSESGDYTLEFVKDANN